MPCSAYCYCTVHVVLHEDMLHYPYLSGIFPVQHARGSNVQLLQGQQEQ